MRATSEDMPKLSQDCKACQHCLLNMRTHHQVTGCQGHVRSRLSRLGSRWLTRVWVVIDSDVYLSNTTALQFCLEFSCNLFDLVHPASIHKVSSAKKSLTDSGEHDLYTWVSSAYRYGDRPSCVYCNSLCDVDTLKGCTPLLLCHVNSAFYH